MPEPILGYLEAPSLYGSRLVYYIVWDPRASIVVLRLYVACFIQQIDE